MPKIKDIHELFESVVTSYNKRELLNYSDLRDIIAKVENKKLVEQFIEIYQNKEQINFIHLREFEMYLNNDRITNTEKNN